MKSFLPTQSTVVGLAIVLLLLIVPLVFSGGTQEASKEAPTLIWFTSVQGGREPAEQPLFAAEVERLTGVKVKIVKTTEDYRTKLAAMLATGEPLDLVYVGDSLFETLWDQQLFAPLTDLIEASPVLGDPSVIPQSEWDRIRRDDGEVYGIFNKFEQGTMPTVRGDWMETLGFGDPQDLDEYYDRWSRGLEKGFQYYNSRAPAHIAGGFTAQYHGGSEDLQSDLCNAQRSHRPEDRCYHVLRLRQGSGTVQDRLRFSNFGDDISAHPAHYTACQAADPIQGLEE